MSCVSNIMPLECLQSGDSGTITDICGDAQTVHRLREMGLCEGTLVSLKRQGTPLLVSIKGKDLLLRCEQSTMILVDVR